MARPLITIGLILCLFFLACAPKETTYVIDSNVASFENEILIALFKASEWKLNLDHNESSHTFNTIGDFLAYIFSSDGRLLNVSLQCPKEENENLYCEFNVSQGQENTLLRFAFDPRKKQLLETFKPQLIMIP